MSLSDQAKPGHAGAFSSFIVTLMQMTPAQRAKASAKKAAAKYGIREDWAAWWIKEAQMTDEQWPVKNGEKR